MAVRNLATVQWLQGWPTAVESRPGKIGPISLGVKQTGERSAGNLHAAFDDLGVRRSVLQLLKTKSCPVPSGGAGARGAAGAAFNTVGI